MSTFLLVGLLLQGVCTIGHRFRPLPPQSWIEATTILHGILRCSDPCSTNRFSRNLAPQMLLGLWLHQVSETRVYNLEVLHSYLARQCNK